MPHLVWHLWIEQNLGAMLTCSKCAVFKLAAFRSRALLEFLAVRCIPTMAMLPNAFVKVFPSRPLRTSETDHSSVAEAHSRTVFRSGISKLTLLTLLRSKTAINN